MAKNRVAPLKKLTIPQLELMAALVGGRLTSHIMSSLRNVKKCVLWSDSQITLHWISSRKQLKTFIANRVIEIKELTCEHSWKYCPTEHNPADLLSRGLSYEQLKNNKLWMHGPDWLTDEKQWPNEFQIDNKVMTTTCKDYENQETQDDIIRTKNNVLNIINVDRYNSFNKTARILGYVQKFIDNCRNTVPNTRRLTTTYLTLNDIHNSTMKLIEAANTKDTVMFLKAYVQNETDCYSADLTTNHETINDQAKRRFCLIEQFLAGWKHEYLTSLREFHRVSGNNNQSVKLGDVVQIYDDNSPRTTWKLGVIEELTYGNDNLVRSATVRTSNSKLNRPIVKLYPLEICASDSIYTQTQRYPRRAKTDAVEKIRKCLK
ncbi:Hypothetical predicted protein [Mytilus galloprovincialis]|uniref:DUF5641 domain-containing protein n=1 Tax=Mytilus galloprovincialis TaxID=29158 RepID=A0A8B6HCU9_MYTGA|nr:Hypothetical predicted protein [Mytilus galloprovincialis]